MKATASVNHRIMDGSEMMGNYTQTIFFLQGRLSMLIYNHGRIPAGFRMSSGGFLAHDENFSFL
jgi:hypothetical protein